MKQIIILFFAFFLCMKSFCQPPGTIIAYAGKDIPKGWEICDGREVSKSDPKYIQLFKAIKNVWGGNANPNFKLPDLRDKFLRGAVTSNEINFSGGSNSHDHSGSTGVINAGPTYGVRDGGDNPPGATGTDHKHSISASEHLPPYIKVMYLIKL